MLARPKEAEADVAARFAKKRGARWERRPSGSWLRPIDVVLPGVTSTARLGGVLVYEARTTKPTYVHGGVADPIEPARRWQENDTAAGKMVIVPGAPAAYLDAVIGRGLEPPP